MLDLQLAGCIGKYFGGLYLQAYLTFSRFGYAVLAAEELTAVANSVKFEYSDGRTFLSWAVGLNVDAAVWIGLFLILATIINLFPVKVRKT